MNVKLMRTARIPTVAMMGAVKMHVIIRTVDKMPIVIATDMKGIANVFLDLLVIPLMHAKSVSIYRSI